MRKVIITAIAAGALVTAAAALRPTEENGAWFPEPAPEAGAAAPAPTEEGGRFRQPETWHGLAVRPEVPCRTYDAAAYTYPDTLEARTAALQGGVYDAWTLEEFVDTTETEVDHIVPPREAADSGLCGDPGDRRRAFAQDPMNLVLASPWTSTARESPAPAADGSPDAAEWLPERNRCWFAGRVIAVKRRYMLGIDRREAGALGAVLAGCSALDMIRETPVIPITLYEPPPEGAAGPARAPERVPEPIPVPGDADPARWDDNGNGRITCAEARRHGIAPVRRGHPAYPWMQDRDGDGVVCGSGGTGRGTGPAGGRRTAEPREAVDPDADPSRWDDNGDGRITCAEARGHGIAPVRRGHPAYPWMRDGNSDGIVCN